MKKIAFVKIIVIAMLFLNACFMDYKSDIAVIKNKSSGSVLVAYQPTVLMTDSMLYNEQFDENWIGKNNSQTISLPNIKLQTQPNSVKCFIHIFNADSVKKYQELKQVQGIVKKSIISQHTIPLNKVEATLDTILVNNL